MNENVDFARITRNFLKDHNYTSKDLKVIAGIRGQCVNCTVVILNKDINIHDILYLTETLQQGYVVVRYDFKLF